MAKKYQIIGEFPSGDSEVDQLKPEQVIFPEGLSTTYQIGKVELENGKGTLVPPGGTLADFFNVFIDEKNPITTLPSVSLNSDQSGSYEVGTKITPSYTAVLNPGSYSYGPDTGITATSWEVTDTAGNSSTSASGSFNEIQVADNLKYQINAKATYEAGAIPVTNTGNEYPDGQIPAGSVTNSVSCAITGYRNSFYGTLTDKSDISSDIIRTLTKSGRTLSNGSGFTVSIPVDAMRVVIAYPATLQDITSIKDVNGMSAEISSGFTKQVIAVEGANNYEAVDYKVYIMDFAKANDTANKFTVTI